MVKTKPKLAILCYLITPPVPGISNISLSHCPKGFHPIEPPPETLQDIASMTSYHVNADNKTLCSRYHIFMPWNIEKYIRYSNRSFIHTG